LCDITLSGRVTRPRGGAIVSGMARAQASKAKQDDAISKLADAGEETLRRLVDFPRRVVVGVLDGAGERMQHVATRLRAVDPLVGRVAELEKRVDSIEKPRKATAQRRKPRSKSRASRKASVVVPVAASTPTGEDPSRGEDDRPANQSG
jgi:hypothetical protein